MTSVAASRMTTLRFGGCPTLPIHQKLRQVQDMKNSSHLAHHSLSNPSKLPMKYQHQSSQMNVNRHSHVDLVSPYAAVLVRAKMSTVSNPQIFEKRKTMGEM